VTNARVRGDAPVNSSVDEASGSVPNPLLDALVRAGADQSGTKNRVDRR